MIFLKSAIAGIRHQKFKYIMLSLLCMITSSCMLIGSILTISMYKGLHKAQSRLGADLIVISDGADSIAESALFNGVPCTTLLSRDWVSKIESVYTGCTVSSQLYLATLSGQSCCDSEVQLIAIDPDNDFMVTPWLEIDNVTLRDQYDIIVGSNFLVEVGDTVTYYNRNFTVVGILGRTGIGYDKSAFITYDAAYDIMTDANYAYLFATGTPDNVCSMIHVRTEVLSSQALKNLIEVVYPNQGISVYSTDQKMSKFKNTVTQYTVFGMLMCGVLTLLTTVAMYTTNTITVLQRKNEVGSFLTVGIPKNKIVLILLLEHLLSLLMSLVMATVIVLVLFGILGNTIENVVTIPVIMPEIGDTIKIFGITAIVHIGMLVLSLSSAFLWIFKHSPADMVKEVI